MKPTTLIAGIGGIAFGVLTIVAAAVGNAPGGSYKVSKETDFVASGHRAAAFVALYLTIIAVLGLICLLARLREIQRHRGQLGNLRRLRGSVLDSVTAFSLSPP